MIKKRRNEEKQTTGKGKNTKDVKEERNQSRKRTIKKKGSI